MPLSWNRWLRILVFGLASTSIFSLLLEMWVPARGARMQAVTVWAFLPAVCIVSALLAVGSRSVRHHILVGLGAGLVGSLAYDLFRVPFVVAHAYGYPGLPLFKVFPRFGQLLLGPQASAWAVHLAGWGYHFCNGASFGLMYVALLNRDLARQPLAGVTFAVALELGMLASPYAGYFGISLSAYFIAVTLIAHAVFGLGVTWAVRRWLP